MNRSQLNLLLALTAFSGLVLASVMAVPMPRGDRAPAPSIRPPAATIRAGAVDGAPTRAAARPEPGPPAAPAPALDPAEHDRQVERIRAALEGSSWVMRRAGARAAAALGDEAVAPALLSAFERMDRHDEPLLRELALALARLGRSQGDEVLLELSRSGHDRYLALLALGEVEGPESLARLREAARNTGSVLAAAGLRGLASRRAAGFEGVVADALCSPEWDLREAALGVVRDQPVPAVAPVLAALLRSSDARIRLAAAGGLIQIDDAGAREVLERALSAGDPFERFEAAYLLARAGDAAAAKTLARTYGALPEDRKPAVLARLGESCPDSLRPFLRGLTGSYRGWERSGAASALARLRDPEALPVLLELLDGPDALLRAAALESLSRLLRRDQP